MDVKDKEGKAYTFEDGKLEEKILTIVSKEGKEFELNYGYVDNIKYFVNYVKLQKTNIIKPEKFATSKVIENYIIYKTTGKIKYKNIISECDDFGEYIGDEKFRYDVFMISNDFKIFEELINIYVNIHSPFDVANFNEEFSDDEEDFSNMKMDVRDFNVCYKTFESRKDKSMFYKLILPAVSYIISKEVWDYIDHEKWKNFNSIIGIKTFEELNTEDNIELMRRAADIMVINKGEDWADRVKALKKEFGTESDEEDYEESFCGENEED